MRGASSFLHHVYIGGPNSALMRRIALNLLVDPKRYPVDVSEVLELSSQNRAMLSAFLVACRDDGEVLEMALSDPRLVATLAGIQRMHEPYEAEQKARLATKEHSVISVGFSSSRRH